MRANLAQNVLRRLRTLIASGQPDPQSDADLLDQFRRLHSEDAFATLLQRHGAMVMSVCRRVLRDEHLAEDAFQATFLVFARKAGSIRNRTALASWLHGVALRLALKHRAQTCRGEKLMSPTDLPDVAARPQTNREDFEILDQELQRLPDRYRLPLLLCYLEGRTHNEAASQLGWSAGKLRGLLDRGRERLRIRLVRRGMALFGTGAAAMLPDTASAALAPRLTESTLRAALSFAAGKSLAESGVAESTAALTEGGLQMIGSKKVGVVVFLVLLATALGTGVALLASELHRPDDKKAQHAGPPASTDIDKESHPRNGVVDPGSSKPGRDTTTRPALAVNDTEGPFFTNCLAFSKDGKLLVTGGTNNYGPSHGIEIWEVTTGRRLRAFDNDSIHCLALTDDGKLLVTGGGATVDIWDINTGKSVRSIRTGTVRSLSVSTDLKLLATAFNTEGDTTARLWDVEKGKEIRVFDLKQAVYMVALSTDGNRLVTGGAIAHVLDTETGEEIKEGGAAVGPLSISADGKKWASLGDVNGEKILVRLEGTSAQLWDPKTGQSRTFKNPEDKSYRNVLLSPDGKWMWTFGHNQFEVPICRKWDTTTGREIESATIRGASGIMAVSPDGSHLVAGYSDGRLALFDAATDKLVRHFSQPQPLRCKQMALSDDGKRLVIVTEGVINKDGTTNPKDGADPRVQMWDLVKGRPESMSFLKPGLLELERSGKMKPRSRFEGPPRIAATVSGDAKWLSIGGVFWDLEQQKQIDKLPAPPDATDEGKKLFERYAIHPGTDAAFSADKKWLVVGDAQGAALWDVVQGKMIRSFPTPTKDPGDGTQKTNTVVAMSPDAKCLATTHTGYNGDWTVILWDVETGAKTRTIAWDGKRVLRNFLSRDSSLPRAASLAFSADGKWLLRGDGNFPDNNVAPRMWEVATGELVRTFEGSADNGLGDIAITPDGKRLLTISFDRSIHVRDLVTGKDLCRLMHFADGGWAVIDTEGRYDASGDIDGLHWTVGNETVPLSHLKDSRHDPGLLAKYLGLNQEPLRKVEDK